MKIQAVAFTVLGLCAQGALAGPGISGGGDQCENRIKEIAYDVSSWINAGGSRGLQLPNGISQAQYSSAMLDQLKIAKIKCVGKGDVGYPVQINGTAKTCRFDKLGSASNITCDFDKFSSISDEDQYVLVHHEYAGLSGIEPASDDDSHYQISNQISAYLEDTVIKKLAVKPAVDQKAICAAEIQKFVRLKFPFYLDNGVQQPIQKVDIDKVDFITATGSVEIEAHALFDEDGFSAIRVFLGAQGVWKNSGTEPIPTACRNLEVKTSYYDPIAE